MDEQNLNMAQLEEGASDKVVISAESESVGATDSDFPVVVASSDNTPVELAVFDDKSTVSVDNSVDNQTVPAPELNPELEIEHVSDSKDTIAGSDDSSFENKLHEREDDFSLVDLSSDSNQPMPYDSISGNLIVSQGESQNESADSIPLAENGTPDIIENPQTEMATLHVPMRTEPPQEKFEFKWYALRTFTSHEQKVKLSIEAEVKRLKLQDKVKEIIIPQETVFEVRGGKRKTRVKNFLPGYILIRTILDKKVKDIISNLPSVVAFVGTKTEPAPLQPHEIEKIIGRVEERRSIETIATNFEIGDPVKVIDGPFTNFIGTVKEINFEKQKLKVEVGILGRKTPVELDFRQVEIENH
jgi:transcriptional antiterminator NusG